MNTALHLDADELSFGAALRCSSVSMAMKDVAQIIESYKFKFKTNDFMCYLSCSRKKGFRREIFSPYKAKRDLLPEVPMLREIKKSILGEYPTICEPKLEADDLLGIAKTRGGSMKNIVVTVDKDLLTVPGWSFNPKKDEYEVFTSEEDAYKNFLKQTIMGDTCDGIPGIPGLGKVAANKLVDSGKVQNLFDVASIYRERDLGDEYFLANARCLRILNDQEYCFEKKKISYIKDKIILN